MAYFVNHFKWVQKYGWRDALKKMYMIGELKMGNYMGQDSNGNKYFENIELPTAQTRWVQYKDIHNFDASMVTPEWHGWLHYTVDEVPTTRDAAGKLPRLDTAKVSDAPYHTFVGKLANPGEVDAENFSTYRPRGYGFGNLYQKYGEPTKYYKQPGHPDSPVADKGGRFKTQKGVEPWNPKDPAGKNTKSRIRSVDDL